jgi:cytochrome c5
MKQRVAIAFELICLLILFQLTAPRSVAQQSPNSPKNSPKKQSTQTTQQSTQTAASNLEGEKRFRTNCSRCHNPPESLSPRQVPAVVRHMRVRAMLSAEDQRLILEYLAP